MHLLTLSRRTIWSALRSESRKCSVQELDEGTHNFSYIHRGTLREKSLRGFGGVLICYSAGSFDAILLVANARQGLIIIEDLSAVLLTVGIGRLAR